MKLAILAALAAACAVAASPVTPQALRKMATSPATPEALRKAGVNAGVNVTAGLPKIVGGFQVLPSSPLHQFQVALLEKRYTNDKDNFFCGGTLYKKQYVITSAECGAYKYKESVQVMIGSRFLDPNGLTGFKVDVAAIDVHPLYREYIRDYDIAVWTLARAVSTVPSVPRLAGRGSLEPGDGRVVTVSGWGYTSNQPPGTPFSPVDLRAAEVPIVGRPNCNAPGGQNGAVTPRMICAGASTKGACFQDNGGPLTTTTETAWDTLTGVVSYNPDFTCTIQATKPYLYTWIGNPEIYDFITFVVDNKRRVLNGWVASSASKSFNAQASVSVTSPTCVPSRQVKACTAKSSNAAVTGYAYPNLAGISSTYATGCTCQFRNALTSGSAVTSTLQCAAYCET